MKDVITERNNKMGSVVKAALEKRGFEAYYCESKAEAAEKVISLIKPGASVSWGGSVSVKELGIPELLKDADCIVLDRSKAKTDEERRQMMKDAMTCDVFLSGANALSEDGIIVNVDGTGNRVAAITFGPESVIIIAGINKIVRSAEDAVTRARTVAAPINAQRFNIKTPCIATGVCGNCNSPDCICSTISIMRHCKPAGRIKVIVVGEILGY